MKIELFRFVPLMTVLILLVVSCAKSTTQSQALDVQKSERFAEPKESVKKQNDEEETRITDLNSALKYGAMLVDVRTPEEFEQGSVPGAVNIPLNTIKNRLDEFVGKKGILVFCRSGNRSRQAKGILEAAGITNVINGGTWQNVAATKAQLGQ